MKLKRNLYILILALTIVAGGTWLTGKIAPEARAYSNAHQYQQAHKSDPTIAEWTYRAFH